MSSPLLSPLWSALYLPNLPLEALQSPLPEAPLAVVEERRILRANAAARALGVMQGQKLSAALALAPQLSWQERNPAREKEIVQLLLLWAMQFSSQVALHAGATTSALLIETRGSIKLFGGLPSLLAALRQGIAAQGFVAYIGTAPTPQGAWLLARAGVAEPVLDVPTLRRTLPNLPAHLLGSAGSLTQTFATLGLQGIADVMALPRGGTERRFGPGLFDEIDRAFGTKPDPQKLFVPPERFSAFLELPYPTASHEALMFVARRLLAALSGFLQARRSGATQLQFTLTSRDQPPLVLPLSLLEPTFEEAHLTRLFTERLARIKLDAPVERVALSVEQLTALKAESLALFPSAGRADGAHEKALTTLMERLNARFADGEIRVPGVQADHRPELATVTSTIKKALPTSGAPPAHTARPLLLIDPPKPLAERHYRPFHEGPLTLLAGPERIESGWWDGNDVARDYFIAQDPSEALLWIYRERRAPEQGSGWFLQGVFA